jgi:organic radical activating enzyme
MLTTDAIADRITEILPFNKWQEEHLVITGGEPLLGWQKQFPELLSHPKMAGLKEITFETNGTMRLTSAFKEYIVEWQMPNMDFAREVTFSVSAKLPVAGV